jgi:hypothetical protein
MWVTTKKYNVMVSFWRKLAIFAITVVYGTIMFNRSEI